MLIARRGDDRWPHAILGYVGSKANLTSDKFTFRRDISRIIKAMWSNPLHRAAFVKSRQYV
jgi:hypothetical protein